MVKRVIQVPVDEELLNDLDSLSKKQRRTRAELIRQACLAYLQQVKNDELDRIYQQGYMKIPEEPQSGEIQVAMSGELLAKESW